MLSNRHAENNPHRVLHRSNRNPPTNAAGIADVARAKNYTMKPTDEALAELLDEAEAMPIRS
jgi:hypothetical protein